MSQVPQDQPPVVPAAARRRLNRQAWWAWLSCPDNELAERLTEYFDGLPPWLDSWPWFGIGLLAGAPLAALATVLVPADAGAEVRLAAALTVWLYVGGALAQRDRWMELAEHFAARVAVTALHLPFLLLAVASIALLAPPGRLPGDGLLLLPLVAAALLVPLLRVTTPRLLVSPDFDRGWPSLAGLPSLAARTVIVLACGLAWAARLPSPWGLVAIVAGLLIVATSGLHEVAAARLAQRLRGRLGPRQRAWPARYRAEPFAFEAALLAVDRTPAARHLAVTYADLRDYTAGELDQALRRLGSPALKDPARAQAAALCALELWANPDAPPEARYRGFARLDAVARRAGEALDVGFWSRFGDLTAGRHQHAEGLRWLLDLRQAMGLTPREAWQRLRRLDWIDALATAAPGERTALIAGVLDLHEAIGDPALLHLALSELETRAFEAGGAPLPEALRRRALALIDRITAGDEAGARSTNDPAYPLEVRRLAYRAAAGGDAAAWYAAARRFEALPETRRLGLLKPAVYASLWAAALQALDDPEERRRQEERYREDRRRGDDGEGESGR